MSVRWVWCMLYHFSMFKIKKLFFLFFGYIPILAHVNFGPYIKFGPYTHFGPYINFGPCTNVGPTIESIDFGPYINF